jgi:hypothetical protein
MRLSSLLYWIEKVRLEISLKNLDCSMNATFFVEELQDYYANDVKYPVKGVVIKNSDDSSSKKVYKIHFDISTGG